MKRLIYFGFVFLLLMLSCSSQDVFRETMGKKQTRALNKWVAEFEQFLKVNLPGTETEEAYNKFMNDASEGNIQQYHSHLNIKEINQLETLIKSSGLWDEIWKTSKANSTKEEEIIFIHKNRENSNHVETKYFNAFGRYIESLKAINSKDSIISDYIHVKEVAGDISPGLIALGLLTGKPDFSNLTIKRIITVEFGWILLYKPEQD